MSQIEKARRVYNFAFFTRSRMILHFGHDPRVYTRVPNDVESGILENLTVFPGGERFAYDLLVLT